MEKQKAAFEDKMLDVELLESKKLVMIEAELEDGRLGLNEKEYHEVNIDDQRGKRILINQQIQASVTAIIHVRPNRTLYVCMLRY